MRHFISPLHTSAGRCLKHSFIIPNIQNDIFLINKPVNLSTNSPIFALPKNWGNLFVNNRNITV